jgi:hypothetical protein
MISPNRKGQYEAYIIIFWLAIRPEVLQRQQIRNTTQKKPQTTKQKKKQKKPQKRTKTKRVCPREWVSSCFFLDTHNANGQPIRKGERIIFAAMNST